MQKHDEMGGGNTRREKPKDRSMRDLCDSMIVKQIDVEVFC